MPQKKFLSEKVKIFLVLFCGILSSCIPNPIKNDSVKPAEFIAAGPKVDSVYSVKILKTKFPPNLIQKRFTGDFDNDGVNDSIDFRDGQITIKLNTGLEYRYSLSASKDEEKRIHDIRIFSLNPDGAYPSILMASAKWTKGFVYSLPQKILLNIKGGFSLRDLGIKLVGRSLDCTRLKTNQLPVCFFASYGDNKLLLGISKLVEITPDGKANDITRKYGLDFPVKFEDWGTDGYHMIGASFFDFNGDGYQDLIAVGQHSRILTAELHPDGYFSPVQYHIDQDRPKLKEFLRVSVPRVANPLQNLTVPPCVYFSMEKSEGQQSDYVECFNGEARYWYKVILPKGPYFMEYTEVMFWDENRDGMLDFAAKNAKGEWTLFTFANLWEEPHASAQ